MLGSITAEFPGTFCGRQGGVKSRGAAKRRVGILQAVSEALECRRLLTAYTLTTIPFDATNGANSSSGLTMDAAGDLFGTTANGSAGAGEVFEIPHGIRTITVLAGFNGTDGKAPETPVTVDANGDVFGTTISGGTSNAGTVFEIVNGSGTITTLASFTEDQNGDVPEGGVILDSNGDVFGTASSFGPVVTDGTVYEVVKGSGVATYLSAFSGDDGSSPDGNIATDSNGDLFGTARVGGMIGLVNTDSGVVWEVGA